jgi:hypothetical protein
LRVLPPGSGANLLSCTLFTSIIGNNHKTRLDYALFFCS